MIAERLNREIMIDKNLYAYIGSSKFKIGTIENDIKYVEYSLMMTYFQALGKHNNPDFYIREEDFPIFKVLWYYFTKNSVFCRRMGINLNKGLLLCGPNGVGKSTIVKMFTSLFNLQKIPFYSMAHLAESYVTEGPTILSRIKYKYNFILDDVGSEISSNFFGNKLDIFESILMKYEMANFPEFRPDEKLEEKVSKTNTVKSCRNNNLKSSYIFATTNLTITDFEERYDSRVYSRIAAYFNIINFSAELDKRIESANVIKF